MSMVETASRYFADPAESQLDLLTTTLRRNEDLRRHLDDLAETIDMMLRSNAWSSDRTSFAAPEVVSTLPAPSPVETVDPPLALAAFERVRDMLALSDQNAASLVGISRNTPRHWRRGDHPKAATTRHLYELVSVLDLVATAESSMPTWARRPSPEGRPWLEVAAAPDGPAAILDHYRARVLAPRPQRRLEVAEDEELDLTDVGGSSRPVGSVVERRQGRRRQPR